MAVPSDIVLRSYGYEVASDFGVNSGNADNHTEAQAWIDACKANNRIGYLPYSPDPYLISDSLACIHRSDYRGGALPFERVQLVGGKDNATGLLRPEFKLTAGATGFGNDTDNNRKPMLYWQAVQTTGGEQPFYVVQPNPLDYPTGWTDATGNLYSAYLHNIDFNTNGHVGAIGLVMFGAQRCYMAEVKVTATGSAGGIWGWPSTNCPSMNIEIVGGDVAIDMTVTNGTGERLGSAAGELIIGLKIDGATIPIKHTSTSCPVVIVGCEILNCPGTVHTVTDPSAGNTSSLCLIDARIDITGGGNPVAFDNPNNNHLYLRDVYVNGTTNLIDSGSEATITGSGTWDRIKEYVYSNQDVSVPPFQAVTASLIDGVYSSTTPEPATNKINGAGDPTNLIRSRHISSIPTMDDPFEFIDAVSAHGADNTATSTSGAEIQAAIDAAETAGHNRVFLRGGSYDIEEAGAGGYGLLLKNNTTLFGLFGGGATFSAAGGSGTYLRMASSWNPTSQAWMIDTPDTASGNITLASFGMQLGRGSGGSPTQAPPVAPLYEWLGAVRWRVNGGVWWGVSTTDNTTFYPDFPPTNVRTQFRVTGNGAGQFYHLEANNTRWNRADARGCVIEGANTGPCLFYGQNYEVSKAGGADAFTEMDVSCEVIDADNVMVFGTKKEGRSGCIKVTNGNNIGYFGGGVLDAFIAEYFTFLGTSDDLVVGMGLHRNEPGGQIADMVREDLDATPEFTIIGDEQVSIYKRGEINMDAMFTPPPATVTPSFVSSIRGTTMTLFFEVPVFFGVGGSTGFTLSASGGSVTPTYQSGSSALTFSLDRSVAFTETVDVTYANPGNGLEDGAGSDVDDFTSVAIDSIGWLFETETEGPQGGTKDSRKFQPFQYLAIPEQNWSDGVAITDIDMNDYMNAGRNNETFITHLWSDSAPFNTLPTGVNINSSTGIISGTPSGTAALTSTTITCDNQCTGDGAPPNTEGLMILAYDVT